MRRGDRVYAAGFDYHGEVEIAALTVKSVGKEVTVAQTCAQLRYRTRVHFGLVATSRIGALEQLVARAEAQHGAAMSALVLAAERVAAARACLAKMQEEGETS